MESKPCAATPGLTMLAGAVLGLAMLFLLRRYPGIYHDSMLYLGQGLMQRWPDIYGQDLFFLHGNQASYTIMPWLLGKAFGLASPPAVFMWGTLASMLGFAAASWFCLCAMLPERQRYWAWLGALCLPSIYGMVRIFSYNEPFLTSRPIAETFCLVALGLMLRQRWLSGVAALACAAFFHPLQAIGAALVIWPWLVMQDRRWFHATWLALPLLLLAISGIEPFAGLFRRADPAWHAEMRNSQQIFMTLWTTNDFKVIAFDLLVLLQARRALSGQFGAWCLAAAVGMVIGMGASLLLVDGLHLVLPSGLQLWRSHWLAHWTSMAAIAALLFHHLRSGQLIGALLLTLTALLAWGETAWGWLAVATLYLAWPSVPSQTRSRIEPILSGLFLIAILLLFANHAGNEFHWFKEAKFRLDHYPIDRRLLVFPALALGLPLLAVVLWERAGRTAKVLLLALVLCPAGVVVASIWDSRSPLQRQVEESAYAPNVFGADIPIGAQVFWYPESLVSVWLVLQRPSFYSSGQLAGQMFDRRTALEGKRRRERVLPLMRESTQCQDDALSDERKRRCQISTASMDLACARTSGLAPDFLVLPHELPQPPSGTWTIKDSATGELLATYRLYRCSEPKRDGLHRQVTQADAVEVRSQTR